MLRFRDWLDLGQAAHTNQWSPLGLLELSLYKLPQQLRSTQLVTIHAILANSPLWGSPNNQQKNEFLIGILANQ